MMNFFSMTTVGILILTAPAPLQAAGSKGGRRLEFAFKRGGILEPALHARQPPNPRRLGGMERSEELRGFLPSCRGGRVSSLPAPYDKRYKMSRTAKGVLLRTASRLRKYADVGAALKAGYLPTEGYAPGLGLALVHPRRMPAAKVRWSSPSLLFYIKEKNKSVYRLVSAAYVAAGKHPKARFKISKAGGTRYLRQWRRWNNLCWWKARGLIMYEDEDDGTSECDGGHFVPDGWILHLWLPLSNPLGIFTPRNPAADYLDVSGKRFPFCHD